MALSILNPQKNNEPEVELDTYTESSEEEYDIDDSVAFTINKNNFGPMYEFVANKHITDIDFNSSEVKLTFDDNTRKSVHVPECDDDFIEYFANKVAINESQNLTPQTPVVETETPELRITVVYKTVATNGTSICIRKTPPYSRISERYAIETNYCSEEVLSLIANCIKAHMNIIVCGQPRAGKTELAKFMSTYIPDEERVITIESVQELRYKETRKKLAEEEGRVDLSDVVEIKTTNVFSYTDAIVASLKQNPRWIMIAEVRSDEGKELIQSFSTGVNGISTLHTDDVSKIPQRFLNMVSDVGNEQRFLKNIYEFVNVGILVSIKTDENGKQYRFIDQVCFFEASDDKGKSARSILVVNDGVIIDRELPSDIVLKLKHARIKINELYSNEQVAKRLELQGYVRPEKKKVKRITEIDDDNDVSLKDLGLDLKE